MLKTSTPFVDEYFEALDEHVVSTTLVNGLSVRFIPRKGFRSGKAMMSARVGSIDMRWTDANGKNGKAPAGVAHYLEHQLFKKADGDLTEAFSELGAYINAHTSHTATSYYSEFVSNRDENLHLLFRLFFEEYFEQKLVDTERDIITQEIRLYRDRPYWVTYGALLESLYQKHSLRFDIAGDEESVGRIGPATLTRAHRAFYAPTNSCLTLAGDWESSEIIETVAEINQRYAPREKAPPVEYWDWQEPSEVFREDYEIRMSTPEERCLIGIKLTPRPTIEGALEQEMLGNLALQMAFGDGTNFLEALYGQGVVSGDFSYGLHVERSFAYASIGGKCRDIPALDLAIAERTEELLKRGFSKRDFQRKLRKIRGSALRRFDTVGSTVDVHAEAWLSQVSPFGSLMLLDHLDVSDVNAVFREIMHDSPRSKVILRQR